MDATNPFPADPVELVRQLDPEVIRNRLEELDRERNALLVLLRRPACAPRPAAKGQRAGC